MITVELDIFSGRPNPRWALSRNEAEELMARLMADRSVASPPDRAGNLGYRGFSISVSDDHASRWLKEGLPVRFYLGKQRSALMESFLLNTQQAEQVTADHVRQAAQDSIAETNRAWKEHWTRLARETRIKPGRDSAEGVGPVVGKPTNLAPPDAPSPDADGGGFSVAACGTLVYSSDTNFSFWNDSYSMANNNCYNFAANYRSHTFAQPGRKSNVQWTTLDCGNYSGSVGFGAAYDGFTNACWTYSQYLTCYVIWPGTDYHWYRLCLNGHWCHKPGSTAARNYDNSGYLITDPYYCNRGNYTSFCSYRYFPHGWTVR